ncbi:MAG: hypothetical protein JWM80_3344 [Cyanobacteria bacterium RYN_339]|nr:hypothetical protein [Cyanobacteria bacterium RYN_339]
MNMLTLTAALVLSLTPMAATGYQLPVANNGVQGAFWVNPPLKGHFSCPMDPDVRSDAPGSCPKCNMDLEIAPTQVRLSLGAGLAGKTVKIAVAGHPSFSHVAKFDAHGNAEASFPLPPGMYTFTADLKGAHLVAAYKLR